MDGLDGSRVNSRYDTFDSQKSENVQTATPLVRIFRNCYRSPEYIKMQRTANENAACLRRICKRSDQPKIERIANNDARLILRKKLNGTTT